MTMCSGTTHRFFSSHIACREPMRASDGCISPRPMLLSLTQFFQARVDEFVSRVQEKASAYQGDDIMLPMGSDFMYQDAHRWWPVPPSIPLLSAMSPA